MTYDHRSAGVRAFENRNFGTESSPIHFELDIEYKFHDYVISVLTETPEGPRAVHAFYAIESQLDDEIQAFLEEVDKHDAEDIGGAASWLLEGTIEDYTRRVELGHGDWLVGDVKLSLTGRKKKSALAAQNGGK